MRSTPVILLLFISFPIQAVAVTLFDFYSHGRRRLVWIFSAIILFGMHWSIHEDYSELLNLGECWKLFRLCTYRLGMFVPEEITWVGGSTSVFFIIWGQGTLIFTVTYCDTNLPVAGRCFMFPFIHHKGQHWVQHSPVKQTDEKRNGILSYSCDSASPQVSPTAILIINYNQ